MLAHLKTRAHAVLAEILWHKTKRKKDILTNHEYYFITCSRYRFVDKPSKTDYLQLFFAAERVRLIGDYPVKGFML